MKTYGKPSIGCYHNTELSQRICDIAVRYGWEPDAEGQSLMQANPRNGLTDEQAELIDALSEEAINWLNEQETRSFLYWANEGEANAFGLWANVEGAKEDCGFVSSKGQEYPPEGDDYTGEWLHINERGNVTLYHRETRESGTGYFDREIWSIC